jgi:hypothetical protein
MLCLATNFAIVERKTAIFDRNPARIYVSELRGFCVISSRDRANGFAGTSHDPRLDDHPAHPIARPTPTGDQLEPVGGRLAAADPRTFSLPGPLPRIRPPLPASPPAELQRSAVGLGGRCHSLVDKRMRPSARGAAAIANAARAYAEITIIITSHVCRWRQRSKQSNRSNRTPRHGAERLALFGESHLARTRFSQQESCAHATCRQNFRAVRCAANIVCFYLALLIGRLFVCLLATISSIV